MQRQWFITVQHPWTQRIIQSHFSKGTDIVWGPFQSQWHPRRMEVTEHEDHMAFYSAGHTMVCTKPFFWPDFERCMTVSMIEIFEGVVYKNIWCRQDDKVVLTAEELRLFHCLLKAYPKSVSKITLLEHLWQRPLTQVDWVQDSAVLENRMGGLRRKFSQAGVKTSIGGDAQYTLGSPPCPIFSV